MAPRSVAIRGVLDALAQPASNLHVCRSCKLASSKRNYAIAATAQAISEQLPLNQSSSQQEAVSTEVHNRNSIKAGVLLSRPPLITPEPHPFETAYYLYQRRLNERLVLPFTQYFYFRRGTPAFDQWRTRRNARGGAAARDIGKYNAYDKEAWNDEVLLGDKSGEKATIVESLIDEEGRGEEFAGPDSDKKMAGLRRTTEADAKNDQRSLERSLSRTLYLLVKSKGLTKDAPENTRWKFPAGPLLEKEGLKEAAQRVLGTSCGPNMNTFFVGNHPVGHSIMDFTALPAIKAADINPPVEKETIFFMKARIFAGQADITSNQNIEDFRWLAKEEIEKVVQPGYWSSIKNMLVDQ